MKINVVFKENKSDFIVNFSEKQIISDGGYERGYEQGYSVGYSKGNDDGQEVGYKEGYSQGHTVGFEEGYNDGLAHRQYETWTITLTDGTVIEKEVALL